MTANPRISQRIRRIYLLGAATLLLFYTIAFNLTLLFAEDSTNLERLKVVAPHHFQQYEKGATGIVIIDPLITLYDSFDTLPHELKLRLSKNWQGITSIFFEGDIEHNVFAQTIHTPTGKKTAYAIEAIEEIEVQDKYIVYIEGIVFLVGILLFVIVAVVIFTTIKTIMQPFLSLADALDKDTHLNFAELKITGEASYESNLTLKAVNQYRNRISDFIEREQKFTRYVSHELRTPMTVIQGCVSILRKTESPKVQQQCTRIGDALQDMQMLTQTFLRLARNVECEDSHTQVNDAFLQACLLPLQAKASSNKVQLRSQLLQDFTLHSDPLLVTVLLQNIVSNAINCAPNGNVSLFISDKQLEVIDNGVGLSSKPRGYEGFGVGLQIVNDICDRYGWQFDIANNSEAGCINTVVFITTRD